MPTPSEVLASLLQEKKKQKKDKRREKTKEKGTQPIEEKKPPKKKKKDFSENSEVSKKKRKKNTPKEVDPSNELRENQAEASEMVHETETATTEPAENPVARRFTVSVALPGSIIANAQSPELKTYLAGQIARACAIFNVDEIVVFSESGKETKVEGKFQGAKSSDPNVFLARVLQYLETPQYLRKALFPVHKDLQYAGLLNPLDTPHHMRIDEDISFREGVVVSRPVKIDKSKGSWVNVGLRKEVMIDRLLVPNVRVTVKIKDPEGSASRKHVEGIAVAPTTPKEHGLYWGYSTRYAATFSDVWKECPYPEGYDVTIGTSERGTDASSPDFKLPSFKHLLIVFGGLHGLEYCIEGDETLQAKRPEELFDLYVNCCPHQGSRTIRTEEAILIAMTLLSSRFPRPEEA